MRHRVLYWDGRDAVRVIAVWREYPVEGVLWVDLMHAGFRQRLQGRDNYWVHDDAFGAFNDPHNLAWYGGDPTKQAEAWRALPTGSILIDPTPPSSAHILRGILVPDGVWEGVTRVMWRIYYDNGTTFDNSMGAPHEAPGLGVQIIVQAHPDVGRELLTRFDWYYWREDVQRWWASDHFGLLDQLTSDRANVVRAVRAGRNASAYASILARAEADVSFPRKSARLPSERA